MGSRLPTNHRLWKEHVSRGVTLHPHHSPGRRCLCPADAMRLVPPSQLQVSVAPVPAVCHTNQGLCPHELDVATA